MIYLLAALGFLIDIAFIVYDDLKHDYVSIILKTLASLCFVLMGVYLAYQKGFSYDNKLIIYCLIADLIGDFILILRNINTQHKDLIFMSGTLAFLIGHIFLIILLIRLHGNVLLISTLISTILFFIVCIPFIKFLNTSKILSIVGALYLYVIGYIFIYSFVAYFKCPTAFGDAFLFAYYLFFMSDVILTISKFKYKSNKVLQAIYRLSYFISQVLIAISIIYL